MFGHRFPVSERKERRELDSTPEYCSFLIVKTILVVDDELPILELIRLALSTASCTILIASSSDEAFQASRQYREEIHLLVTDIKMDPYMRGEELAQCMRQLRPGIRVLYVSGFPLEGAALAEVESGEADFLAKPFTVKDLLAKASPILEQAAV